MAVIKKNSPDHKKAIQIITEYSDSCPKCHSDNISNEDDLDSFTCHNCSHQFSDSDYMQKFHIVAWLNVKGLPHMAEEFAAMDQHEFEDFLANHIYE